MFTVLSWFKHCYNLLSMFREAHRCIGMHLGMQSHSLELAARTKVCPNVQFSTSNVLLTQATHLQFKMSTVTKSAIYESHFILVVKMHLPQPSFMPTHHCSEAEHYSQWATMAAASTQTTSAQHIMQVTLAMYTSMPSSLRMCMMGPKQSQISLTCSTELQGENGH